MDYSDFIYDLVTEKLKLKSSKIEHYALYTKTMIITPPSRENTKIKS